ncbi:hypothetical protein TRFO_05955 [Tritrichomonas foetus]|uniref:Leucine Rich Repeat family protein n=1 Tax=Tritrichomonas foetus TaxID=1144522 RepID=A0A1J4K6M1_9EUKA|nr:hypothetical protein TRFO_05955 [Tritrichomonas foetus]|eukprot:OHT05372.1 hypothetical protein TRFO_05955 [Tritrichomonas foetus]
MEATKFVPLKPDIVQKILDQRIDSHETNQWAGEAIEIEEQTAESKAKRKVRYLLLTEICLYVLDKAFKKQKRMYSYFDFCAITPNNEGLTLELKTKKLHFILPDSSAFVSNLYTQIKKLTYGVSTTQLTQHTPIASNPNFLKHPPCTKRPPHLSLTRYLSATIAKDTPPENYIMSELSKFDESPHTVLKFSNSEMQLHLPLMFTLTMESFIRNLSFDNFAVNNLGQTLNWVLALQNRVKSLDLWNYDNVTIKGFQNRRSPFNHLGIIRIHHCSSHFIVSFLESLKSVNYSIDTLIFDDIKFDQHSASLLVQFLQTTTFLSSLNSLGFTNCQYVGGTFIDFATQCIKACEHLVNFNITNCEIDVCDMLLEITKSEIKIQHVSLRRNSGKTIIGHDETIVANSVLTVDVGECEWTDDSFVSFISAICRRLRRSPLALTVDHTNISAPWSEVFERLPIESFMPILTELNISNNQFDDKAFTLFLNFLETQTPFMSISKTKLMHLNISHCFTDNLSENVKKLVSFFSKRELWGLEICGCPPVPELINITGLHALNIGDNDFDRVAINALIKFVSDSTTLSEIGLNNIKFQDVKTMMQFYTSILTHSKILAFSPLTSLFTEYSNYTETEKIKDFLTNKRSFSNTVQRISLFLGLAGDFSTHVSHAISLSDVDEIVYDNSKASRQLVDVTLADPVQSLFTLATKNSVDMTVDPVASMVSEYVATSGRYGIVPPTAPPSVAPNTEFLMPSIFCTMLTRNELEGDDFVDFDPMSTENQKISESLAEVLKARCKPIKPSGTPELWCDTKKTIAFRTIEIPNA